MPDFPQDIVYIVIKDLYGDLYKSEGPKEIWKYATVSRKWLHASRGYTFTHVTFKDQDSFENWCRIIEPGPDGASSYVRQMRWEGFKTLAGFEGHVAALTAVEHLEIHRAETTSENLVSLLAHFPGLRRFSAEDLEFKDEIPPPSTKLFGGVDEMTLSVKQCDPARLDWISPTAKFRRLTLGTLYVREFPEAVNALLVSSGESLKHFCINGILYDYESSTSLNLSACTSLETLQFPIPQYNPEKSINSVLSSVSSREVFAIALNMEKPDDGRGELQGGELLDRHLCRLAKQFSDAHHGERMTVEGHFYQWSSRSLLSSFRNGEVTPELHKVANVVAHTKDYGGCQSFF